MIQPYNQAKFATIAIKLLEFNSSSRLVAKSITGSSIPAKSSLNVLLTQAIQIQLRAEDPMPAWNHKVGSCPGYRHIKRT